MIQFGIIFFTNFFPNSILILLSSTINILVLSKYSLIGWVLLLLVKKWNYGVFSPFWLPKID
jgi:hypothetical protein